MFPGYINIKGTLCKCIMRAKYAYNLIIVFQIRHVDKGKLLIGLRMK